MTKITKAIIPVAGWGTRMLPITKAIEKCMLPIGTRPVIDYVVRDLIDAGVDDIYFVVGEQSTQVQNYYRSNIQLNDYLKRQGKEDKLPLVAPIEGVKFHFIMQPSSGKYGTAVPVGLVNDYIDDGELVAVIMGDDFIYNQDGTNEIKRLLEAAGDSGSMIGVNVRREDVSKYGVLQLDQQGNYQKIVEKPRLEDAPSTLINVSKYVLPKAAIEAAVTIPANPVRGEYEITDVINQYVTSGGVIKVVEAQGEFLDAGSVDGWLHANNVILG
ncbi:MAG TPA: sugar phosphate nucleotidyltransferase [Candidatus Saccharimonadales bacterium]